MTEISFNKTKLITGTILCMVFILFLSLGIMYTSNSYMPVFLFLILVSLHILIFHKINHLIQHGKKQAGFIISPTGLLNNTPDTPVFIPWHDIEDFQHGFYRANHQIFIKVHNPEKYEIMKRNTYLKIFHRIGKYFRSKPDLLWIDVEILSTTESQLLMLLRSNLNTIK